VLLFRSSWLRVMVCLALAAMTSPTPRVHSASAAVLPERRTITVEAARSSRILEDETERAIQQYRLQKGLPELTRSPALDELARDHSRDMAARGYTAHRSPDGEDAVDRATRHGVAFLKIGENIARTRGARDPVRQAVDGWIHSPSHRQVLLDPDYLETGVGVAVDAGGTSYFTQIFLRRQSEDAAAR
jgi:uncharacterized protein YkwD